MVCAGGQSTPATSGSGQEIRMALIVVRDLSTATMQVGNISISLASTVPVRSLLEHVSLLAKYQNGTFELLLQRSTDSNAVRCAFSMLIDFEKFIRLIIGYLEPTPG